MSYSITFEEILNRMLSKVPKNMDKSEGSIIYDALAPCAVELQLMYIEMNNILVESFGDSASREYLIRRAKERGLVPKEATHAYLQGEFDIDIPIGSRFSCDKLFYTAKEKISDGIFKMQCETTGVIGNSTYGRLTPVDYIDGLTSAELSELLIPAEDEEDTEVFRNRYLNTFDNKSYGGNISDYLEKVNAIDGVGAVKVTPVWNGGGTVKLTVLDSEFNKATYSLIESVQNEIDPTKDGSGVGIAPIGHIVTVDTASEVMIDISTDITFKASYDFNIKESEIVEVMEQYLLELRQEWALNDSDFVRIGQIEFRIMNIEGVVDIQNTKINGVDSNFSVGKYEIPVLGVLTNG